MQTQGVPVIARIVRMSHYIERRLSANLARFDLCRDEFEVMAVLARNPRREFTPKVLQSKILVSSGGLSNRIKSLEAKGLLTCGQSTGDGREVILRATKAGRDVALKAAASHMQLEREMLQGLPAEDAAELAELLRRLILLQEEPLNKDGRK